MKKNNDKKQIISEEDTEITSSSGAVKSAKPGMVKKQKIMIIAFASVAALLIILYFAVVMPIVKKRTPSTVEPPPALIDGEAYDDTGRYILMFPHVEMKNIKSIEVHNSYEDFSAVRDKDGVFYIEEHPQAPIGTEIFTSFAVDAGYTVVNRRVTEKCEDFSLYGLGENDSPAYYILTTTEGVSYTVYIGDRIPSGGGFYARVKDRDALYVMSSNISNTVLAPSTALMSAILGAPLTQNDYSYIDEVILSKNGEPFIYITYTKQDLSEFRLSAYEMVYPANYIVNDENYASIMLYSFVTLAGDRVLEVGSPDAFLRDNEAIMAEYGFYDIYNMPIELYYSYNDQTSAIAFAPSGVDGYYFAYSYLYDMIVLIKTETVPYIEWDLLDYVSSALFAEYINEVEEITVDGDLIKNGKIYDINERFTIKSVDNGSGTTMLECYAHSTGKKFTGYRPANNPVQAFYGTVLMLKMQGYIKTEGIDVSTLDEYASMTVKMNNGDVTVYKFYRYSERCYYTIDGSGEFYMALRDVNKLLIDAVRAAYGLTVDSSEQYPELPEFYQNKQ